MLHPRAHFGSIGSSPRRFTTLHATSSPGALRNPKLCKAVINSGGLEASMSKRVLVPIATGSEEMEAVITIDVLRRAGAEVVVASVEPSLQVQCSRGVQIVADKV